jgi:hypothetical protein
MMMVDFSRLEKGVRVLDGGAGGREGALVVYTSPG